MSQEAETMPQVSRREIVGLLAGLPLAMAMRWPPVEIERALRFLNGTRPGGVSYQPKFFTPAEWTTVRVLADLVIPPDQRSGGATDAGVPEFMDFMMLDRPDEQLWMRGGLAWVDAESSRRFGRRFTESDDRQRRSLLDDIAWPAQAEPQVSQGAAFFTAFRDLTASGFWSSKIGVADLAYQGNMVVVEWTGCPAEALAKLGVAYQGER
jgi:gluconate 2-dehydrogenase gamma chain